MRLWAGFVDEVEFCVLRAPCSVRPLCPLWLFGEFTVPNTHHQGTEDTKVAQRFSK